MALPRLLEKILAKNLKVVLKVSSYDRLNWLDELLWTYDKDSFLPHGKESDGNSSRQPIFLTVDEKNPNNASIIILVDGCKLTSLNSYEMCLDIFDGEKKNILENALQRYEKAKGAGNEVTYWQQNNNGSWQKAELPSS
tara:strand:- start:924 stop:1340 length:417 start_codon:yes stop_codon:yes gene_type:complete